MAVRIAVALFTALRAVLVYGEATDLATRPIELPRLRSARSRGRGRHVPAQALARRPASAEAKRSMLRAPSSA
jgi:hypothetical protein